MSERTHVLMPISGTISYSDMVAAMLPLLRFEVAVLTLLHVIETPVATPLESPMHNVVLARNVADAIIQETQNADYAFVFMMKRRKRKGIRGLFSRSVTERVIRYVECPVVTVLV
jgi:nucleotide-binding universal stress UspA family protein